MTRERAAGLGLVGALAALLAWNLVTLPGNLAPLAPRGQGDVAPEVLLRPLDPGGPRSLLALRGKVVLIDFWATWCGPCRQSMPAIERLWQRFRDAGLVVVSVNVEGDGPRAQAFARGFRPPLTFPLYTDDGTAQAAFHVDAIPQLVLVGKDGRIELLHIGGVDEAELTERIEAALR